MLNKVDILVFAAHPDDAELACSGTIMRHISLGYKVGIVDLTQGELGSRGSSVLRLQESKNSAAILGIHQRDNLGLADGFFSIEGADIMKIISSIRKYQPTVVLCNAPKDRHPDHSRAHELIKRAAFLSGLLKVETELNGQKQKHWRPDNVYSYIQDYYLEPSFVVDIGAYWPKKIEAIKAFQSQFYDPMGKEEINTPISGKDFFDFIEARARSFGRIIGVEFGEGFLSETAIKANNFLEF